MISVDEDFDIEKLTKEEITETIEELETTLGKHVTLFFLVLGLLIVGTILMTLSYLPFNWISIIIMLLCIYDVNRNLRLGRLISAQLTLFRIVLIFKKFEED